MDSRSFDSLTASKHIKCLIDGNYVFYYNEYVKLNIKIGIAINGTIIDDTIYETTIEPSIIYTILSLKQNDILELVDIETNDKLHINNKNIFHI